MYAVYDEDNGEFERLSTHKALEEHITWLLEECGIPANAIAIFREMDAEIKVGITVKLNDKKLGNK